MRDSRLSLVVFSWAHTDVLSLVSLTVPQGEMEFAMNKPYSAALVAGMLLVTINGFAVAQTEPVITPKNTQQETRQDTQPELGGDLSAKEQEYLVALTKCESLNGSQKTKCIELAKKKFGQM